MSFIFNTLFLNQSYFFLIKMLKCLLGRHGHPDKQLDDLLHGHGEGVLGMLYFWEIGWANHCFGYLEYEVPEHHIERVTQVILALGTIKPRTALLGRAVLCTADDMKVGLRGGELCPVSFDHPYLGQALMHLGTFITDDNILKGDIFRSTWKYVERNTREQFLKYYFAACGQELENIEDALHDLEQIWTLSLWLATSTWRWWSAWWMA